MTLNLTVEKATYPGFTPRITVIGVGGAGTNAVDNMIDLNLQGVEFIVANTDAQQLSHSLAGTRIQLGPHLTQGLGAGAKPEIGEAAAEEAADEIYRHLDGANMVFITAGMGGGTGTGAAPVIARMAREKGILVVGVVTRPFDFEGRRRAEAATRGIAKLQHHVDTLLVIPNQNLFRLANEKTGWKEAFKMADNVLYMGVRGITDLMMTKGLINLDFADVRTVMIQKGKAMMGTGEAEGEERALRAAEAAISNPLLESGSMQGARGLLINISGGEDLTLMEVEQAASRIGKEVDEDADILFGSAIDPTLEGRIRVSIVATGLESEAAMEPATPPLFVVNGGRAEPTAAAIPRGERAPITIVQNEPMAMDTQLQPTLLHADAEPMPVIDMPPSLPPLTQQPLAQSHLSQSPMSQPTEQAAHAAATTRAQTGRTGARASTRNAAAAHLASAELFPTAKAEAEPAPERQAGPARAPNSLFVRMTGLLRGGKTASPAPSHREPAMPRAEARAEPRGETHPDPRAEARQDPRADARPEPRAEARTEPRPQPRQAAAGSDEIFEIPTFLRRQTH